MEKLFNKIVVPFDFSTKSEKALNKAVEIARKYIAIFIFCML